MIDKVAELSHQLREVGLPVSIRSTHSAAQVYQDLGENDRNLLKTALRAIYVKDKYDIPKFNKIFENVFKKEVSSSHKYKKTISALLYITQNIFGQNLSRDKRIDIIKEIYGEHKIEHLYIWGDFYSLDFSNIEIYINQIKS